MCVSRCPTVPAKRQDGVWVTIVYEPSRCTDRVMPVGRAVVFEELQAVAEPIARQVGRNASTGIRLTPWPSILSPGKTIEQKRESKDHASGTLK